MRHSYTPIFQDTLTSRIWALPDAHLRVWLWLQLKADPEGYICADLAGVAVGARVSGQDARDALEALTLPDADADPEDPHQGRLLERVRRGWRLLDFESKRELAKKEARNARNRRYMAKSRVAANDTEPDLSLDAALSMAFAEGVDAVSPSVPSVAPPKSKPKSKPKPFSPDGENLPQPPQPVSVFTSEPQPRVVHELPVDWAPSPALLAAAKMAGVSDLAGHIARLRQGPIGGNRGVFAHQIDAYVEGMLGKMRTWEEADRAKGGLPGTFSKPLPPKDGVHGMPPWVRKSHLDYLAGDRKALKAYGKRFVERYHLPVQSLIPNEAATAFQVFLKGIVRGTTEAA
jgi:hypothetical protein